MVLVEGEHRIGEGRGHPLLGSLGRYKHVNSSTVGALIMRQNLIFLTPNLQLCITTIAL